MDEPKELHGHDALRHWAEIAKAVEAGKEIQFFQTEWNTAHPNCFHFDCPAHRYRVKPEAIVRYVNVYAGDEFVCSHKTRRDADARAGDGRIACIRIEIETGRFDD